MKCDYDSVEEALADSNLIPTRCAYITGRSAVGKTTFAKKLAELGHFVIDNDLICKNIINPHFNLNQKDSIAIFHGKAPVEVEDMFVAELHKVMDSVPEAQKIVSEGVLSSPRVFNRFFSGKYAEVTVFYLMPTNRDKYKAQVMERFSFEVANNLQFLPIWTDMDPKIVEAYKQSGYDSPLVMEYIEKLVTALFEGSQERYELLASQGVKMVTIAV